VEKSLKRAELQRHGALLLDEGGVNGGKNPESDSDEESKALHRVLIESWRSRDGAGSSDGGSATCATSEDGAVWKRSASLPLRRLSSKHPCATAVVVKAFHP